MPPTPPPAPTTDPNLPAAVVAAEAFVNSALPLIPGYGALIAALAPAGEKVINYIIGLFVKHAAGLPVSDDWKGLIAVHATATGEQRLQSDIDAQLPNNPA